jgi:hypothetical protein
MDPTNEVVEEQVEQPTETGEDIHAIPVEVEAEEPKSDETPEPETLLRVRLRSGKEYTGKTERDILQALVSDHEKAQADLETRDKQIQEVQGKVRYQEERRGDAWDPQKYLDLLGTDPMEARRYQDRFYYGVEEDVDVQTKLRNSQEINEQIFDSIQIHNFKRTFADPVTGKLPAFSEEDAAMLFGAIDNAKDTLTTENLLKHYYTLEAAGRVKSYRPNVPNMNNAQYNDIQFGDQSKPESRGKNAPKVPGSGGKPQAEATPDLESMTLDQLREYARKQGRYLH